MLGMIGQKEHGVDVNSVPLNPNENSSVNNIVKMWASHLNFPSINKYSSKWSAVLCSRV